MKAARTLPDGVSTRSRRTLGRRLAALVAATALGLAACTSPSPDPGDAASNVIESGVQWSADPTTTPTAAPADEWRSSVSLRPLAVPTEMTLSADRLDLGGMLGPADDRPALVAAIGTVPGGRRNLHVSTWDGAAWQPSTVDAGVPGEPQDVEIAGSSTATAMAGWTWAAGTVTPFLLVSSDRRGWTPVALPDALAGYRLVAVDADGPRIVALGQDARGSAAIVTIDGAGDPEVAALPPIPARQNRHVIDVTIAEDTVLVVAGRDVNHNGPPQVLRSTDAGRTWTDPVAISDSDWARVYGVTAVTGGYLATGTDRASTDGADRRATAWFSVDGVAWQAEPLPEPEGFRKSGDDSRAGAPTASGDAAFTVLASDSTVGARVFVRRAPAQWVELGATPEIAGGFGYGGLATPAGPDPSGAVLVAQHGALGLTLGQLAEGNWATLSAPAVTQEVTSFRSARSADPRVWRAEVQQPHFENDSHGWNRWWGLSDVGLSGDALAVLPADPPEAAGWTLRAYSGTAEIALVSDFVQSSSALAILGWYRASPGEPWRATTGFGADRWEQASAADNVGGLWLVAGGRQPQITSDFIEQAMIWYSVDGITWARAEGDFAQEDRASRITGFCGAPEGRRAAVGEVTGPNDQRIAALWVEQDGRWLRHELPTDADRRSTFSSCADVAGTVVIDGSMGGRAGQWSWAPEKGFSSVDPPTPDKSGSAGTSANRDSSEFGGVKQVPGGYVAVGRLDAAAHTGPVIWLSADGTSWEWLPLPVTRPDAWALTAGVGGDLVVMTSSATGAQAWRVTDIASLIASIPAES